MVFVLVLNLGTITAAPLLGPLADRFGSKSMITTILLAAVVAISYSTVAQPDV